MADILPQGVPRVESVATMADSETKHSFNKLFSYRLS